MSRAAENDPIKGVVAMVVGAIIVTACDAVLKWTVATYPPGETIFIRNLFLVVPIAIIATREGGWAAMKINSLKGQILRTIGSIGSIAGVVYGLKLLPFADVMAFTFAMPLIVTALSPWVLGEPVGWRRWLAVLVGFSGVVLMLDPAGSIRWEALIPLVGAAFAALRDLVTRRLAVAQESAVATLAFTMTGVSIASLFTAPFGWSVPTWPDFIALGISGVFVGFGLYLFIICYRYGDAALVAPFRYTQLIWAALIGYLIWGEVPKPITWAGAALVIGSGLYILHRETQAKKKAVADR